jgi:glyoxalase family protein
MAKRISGVHHITAIASDAQKNLDFYTGVLGLRLVKLTVNFDDPGTYHLYYGDYSGQPGTILTFFPWRGIPKGQTGPGEVVATTLAVPSQSLPFWEKHLSEKAIPFSRSVNAFGEDVIAFSDGDGMKLQLVEQPEDNSRAGWPGGPIPAEASVRGIAGATIETVSVPDTEKLVVETMGFQKIGEDGNKHRFEAGTGSTRSIVDLVEPEDERRGRMGAGTVHHIAWRTPNDVEQIEWRRELAKLGYGVSPVMDRQYFHSIYYREPGGVLFEIATDPPGFTTDEPVESLGSRLMLPPWLEKDRGVIEASLPKLNRSVTEVAHV